MSYVLEALKKQEAGNDPDAAVSLAQAAAHNRRQRRWAGWFAVALMVNVALLGWVFGLPLLQTRPPAPESAGLPQPQTPAAGPSDSAVPATSDPAAEVPAGHGQPAHAPAVPAPVQAPVPAQPAPLQRVSLGRLPSAARGRFPGIAFSAHIYSEDADLRAIVANGKRVQEGERVAGLVIREISESGVVLEFERYLVEVPMVTDWDDLP